MKKTFTRALCIALVLLTVGALSLSASAALKAISAYLNYGVTIKYDGEAQTMYDANGTQVYPITYNGTTYLPVRAIADMFGIAVEWDGANNAVLLGEGASNANTDPTIMSVYDGYTFTKLPFEANGIRINSVSVNGTKVTVSVTNNTGHAIGGNSSIMYSCYGASSSISKKGTFYLENMNDGETALVSFVLDKEMVQILFTDVTVHKGVASDNDAATCSIIEMTNLPYEVRGLVVNSVSVSGTKATLNVTNNTGAAIKAISNIAYKCYDKDGVIIKSGGISLAALADGESADVSFYIESGTAKILLGDAAIYDQ